MSALGRTQRLLAWRRTPEAAIILMVAVWSAGLDLAAEIGIRFLAPVAHPGRGALTAAWRQWDAGWYRQIAALGYHALPTVIPPYGTLYRSAAFYPGYPLLARGVYEVLHPFGIGLDGAMLLTNQALVLAMALLLYRFARTLTGDDESSLRTVRYLLLFPFAYFLIAPYSETLFLTCTAGFCWALSTRRYGLAAVCAGLATGTRFVGIVLPVVLVVGYLEHHRWRVRSLGARMLLGVPVALSGAIGWAVYQAIEFGNPFYSQHVEKLGWSESFNSDVLGVIDAGIHHPDLTAGFVGGVSFETFIFLPLIALAIGLTVVVLRRFGAAFALLCASLAAGPILAGKMLSYNRFFLPILPFFVVLGLWGRRRWFDTGYTIAGTLLLGVFLTMYVHGVWTG